MAVVRPLGRRRPRLRGAMALVAAMVILASCGTSLTDQQAARERQKGGEASGQAASALGETGGDGVALSGSGDAGGAGAGGAASGAASGSGGGASAGGSAGGRAAAGSGGTGAATGAAG